MPQEDTSAIGGAIAVLERAIGAPLSEAAKQTVELMAIQAFSEGLSLARDCQLNAAGIANTASAEAAKLATAAARHASYLVGSKLHEAAEPQAVG